MLRRFHKIIQPGRERLLLMQYLRMLVYTCIRLIYDIIRQPIDKFLLDYLFTITRFFFHILVDCVVNNVEIIHVRCACNAKVYLYKKCVEF